MMESISLVPKTKNISIYCITWCQRKIGIINHQTDAHITCIKFTWTLRLEWIRTVCNIDISQCMAHCVLNSFAKMDHQNQVCWCTKSEPKITHVSVEIYHIEEECYTVVQRKIRNASNISVSSTLQEISDISQTS